MQAPKENNAAPGAELPAARRPECVPEAHGWAARKKQRTADTSDMQKAALSNACKQPAAILGLFPCPADDDMVPLVRTPFWGLYCTAARHNAQPLCRFQVCQRTSIIVRLSRWRLFVVLLCFARAATFCDLILAGCATAGNTGYCSAN